MSRYQNPAKNRNINRSFEDVTELRCLGTTVSGKNLSHEEIKSKLNSSNDRKLLISRLLSKNINITIYRTTVSPVVLYGCGTWCVTWRTEHGLGAFGNWGLRRILEPRRVKIIGGWRKLHNEELHNLYSLPNTIRIVKSRRMRWAGHVACTDRSGMRRKT
jgi:hypothetical protein